MRAVRLPPGDRTVCVYDKGRCWRTFERWTVCTLHGHVLASTAHSGPAATFSADGGGGAP